MELQGDGDSEYFPTGNASGLCIPGSDTSILGVGELQRAEEELEVQEEDGVKLEAFNLKEERARGHFDEAGNYVQDVKGSDEEEEEDAWLKSEEGRCG